MFNPEKFNVLYSLNVLYRSNYSSLSSLSEYIWYALLALVHYLCSEFFGFLKFELLLLILGLE